MTIVNPEAPPPGRAEGDVQLVSPTRGGGIGTSAIAHTGTCRSPGARTSRCIGHHHVREGRIANDLDADPVASVKCSAIGIGGRGLRLDRAKAPAQVARGKAHVIERSLLHPRATAVSASEAGATPIPSPDSHRPPGDRRPGHCGACCAGRSRSGDRRARTGSDAHADAEPLKNRARPSNASAASPSASPGSGTR